jgi:hypothetical protein
MTAIVVKLSAMQMGGISEKGRECLYSQHQTGRSCSLKRASNARHVE